jgi:hypothetical protein
MFTIPTHSEAGGHVNNGDAFSVKIVLEETLGR